MQVIDFLLFLFLGYYLQNVLPHEFGIRKPFYFICTKNYWCGSKKNENGKNLNQNIEILEDEEGRSSQKKMIKPVEKHKKNDSNFESEDLYKDKTKPDDALRIENIVKIFGDGKKAVDNVSLNFYKDEIFALLGHNGAGKTTLISMLTGLYEATEGSAYFDNYNILGSNNMEEFRTILGICPQHDVLFDDLNIREHLEMFCIFKGFSSGNIDAEVDKTIHDFELENIQNITSKNLSAGQRRKLSIAISLIGGSKVIFLDEPSSGMDITSRRNLWDILKRQSEQKIIILTTHYMEEASVLGKRIGIINAGKMKCIGTPLFLIERFGRFMSLNITKEQGADNRKIINFIGERAKDIDFKEKIKVIYHGVKLSEKSAPLVECKTKYLQDVEKDKFVISCASRFSEEKGNEFLIRSIEKLNKMTSKPFKVLLANEGQTLENCKKMVKDLKLEKVVKFLGYLKDDIDDLYLASDICVTPSKTEGLGLATLESLRFGVPCVVTETGGLTEIINDKNKCGIVVTYGQEEEMANALLTLMDDENLRKTYKLNAKKVIEDTFSLDKMLKNTEYAYNEVLKEREYEQN